MEAGNSRRGSGSGYRAAARANCRSGAGMSEMDLKYSLNSMERGGPGVGNAAARAVNGSIMTVYSQQRQQQQQQPLNNRCSVVTARHRSLCNACLLS